MTANLQTTSTIALLVLLYIKPLRSLPDLKGYCIEKQIWLLSTFRELDLCYFTKPTTNDLFFEINESSVMFKPHMLRLESCFVCVQVHYTQSICRNMCLCEMGQRRSSH